MGTKFYGPMLLTLSMVVTPLLAQQPDPNEVASIQAMLQQHDVALNAQDSSALMEIYAREGELVLMGTGPGERYVGKDEITDAYKHFFADFDKGSMEAQCDWRIGDIKGDLAWLMSMCNVSDAKKATKREYGLNISSVWERRDEGWRLRAMHFSNLTGEQQPPATP